MDGERWHAEARVRGKYAAPQNRRFSPDGEGRAERGVQNLGGRFAAAPLAAEDGGY